MFLAATGRSERGEGGMSVTTVEKPSGLEGKEIARTRAWRCQFCATGHHGSCPGAVRQLRRVGKTEQVEEYLWLCECPESGHPGLHCLECKNTQPGEVNTKTWMCVDRHVCAGILQKRRENSQLWQMIQAAKSASAIKRRAKRLGMEEALAGLDTHSDVTIERMHTILDNLEEVQGLSQHKPRRSGPAKPKTGSCECCGEPTRGGRFLPGHDARLASALKKRVESGDADAYAEMKRRNWLKKLPEQLRSGVK